MSNLSRKNRKLKLTVPETIEENRIIDFTLRPRKWDEFVGQERIKKNLKIIIEAAKKRDEGSFEHLLC